MDVMKVCRQLRGCRQNIDIPGQLLENLVKTPHGPHTSHPACNITQFGWPTDGRNLSRLVLRLNSHQTII